MIRYATMVATGSLLAFTFACGGSTPAYEAVGGEETGNYEGVSGAPAPPAMEHIGEIDTIPEGGRPLPDTVPITPPPPPLPPPQP